MRFLARLAAVTILAATALPASGDDLQTAANLAALKGLLPFSVLPNTPAGKAALAADDAMTAAIQHGAANQPGLLPFAQQQQQALKDAFVTFGNASQLAEGLGSKLGGPYQAATSVTGMEVCGAKGKVQFANVSPNVARLLGYTATLTGADAAAGKYFFANETTNGKTPVAAEAASLLAAAHGQTDVFGKAYGDPAGGAQADPFGDSRPFQTEKNIAAFSGADYFGVMRANTDYLSGPVQCLQKSPAFPSGHTTYGYTESLLLAIMLPECYTQMITRGAEYGNGRIIMGAHYAMDVIAGRALALYDVAHLLAENPVYVGQAVGKLAPIDNYAAALKAARTDLRAALQARCGAAIAACAGNDSSRFKDSAANAAFYQSTQTYGLPVVYPATANKREDVAAIAPEAGYLLTAAFPKLTLAQADGILTSTEGAGGGFLDNGSAFGLYARLDLYKAGQQAATFR